MMIRPGEMPYAVIHFLVRIPGSLGAELPDAPVGAVPAVEEGDEAGERIAVG